MNQKEIQQELEEKTRQLKSITEQYNSLSKEEKKKKKGKGLLRQFSLLSEEIKELESANNDISVILSGDIMTQDDLQEIKKPKYIRISGQKILTPRELVVFKYEGFNFLIYGDKRCQPKFTIQTLQELSEKNLVLIVLRTTKKKQGKEFAFTVPLERVLQSRKYRLAVAMSLPSEDKVEFMKEELNIDSEIEEQELEDTYLTSLKDELIVKDITRIIQLYYQDSRIKSTSNERAEKNKYSNPVN